MSRQQQDLLATFQNLSSNSQEEVLRFIQYLQFKQREMRRRRRETRYMVHIDSQEGIFLIEDE